MDDSKLGEFMRNLAFSMQTSVRLQQETFAAELLRQVKYADPKHLARHEHQVFSQSGEDGIIQEIFRRIGTESKSFVEIGTGDGLENNTTLLLSQGWRGVWVEGSSANVQTIQKLFAKPLTASTLRLIPLFVTRENIAAALQNAHVPSGIDFLSLDVDQNTYFIWQALSYLRPRAVVIEYNATYPPAMHWTVAYNPARSWDGTFYYGASLKAFEKLGLDLGYYLVGCDLSGNNAFFVRHDLCQDRFVTPFDAETHYEPPRFFLIRGNGHRRGAGFASE